MKIVIDIPEGIYELLKTDDTELSKITVGNILLAVADGIPLPKGHGRLIDADELEECKEIMDTISDGNKYAVRMEYIRNVVSTIIEADKRRDNK